MPEERKEERKLDAVEDYFGITYKEAGYDSYLFRIMMRIQTDYENGHFDIEHYAAMYGY